ncbi:hypothetical protein CKO42_26175 [Lamprobacter modestohalophilus]|uniref:HEPN domain-containing protein n=1 Tax=Lamprobacter modestohalophilus TaxID=1064514 RepID=A0A9X0WE70_9GAMM|nr:HEPN domain-containing protein [Lamprobacter modestohalophilus]MBK1621804.1 hypothetical protein [Lamprobacter modestohalophilus]
MTLEELEANLRQKYRDAVLLAEHQRYANAIYLGGYCLELGLKYAIAKHLHWDSYRTDGDLRVLKSHKLPFLLQFTGQEAAIKNAEDWQIASKWTEAIRYQDPRAVQSEEFTLMLEATRRLVEQLCAISL